MIGDSLTAGVGSLVFGGYPGRVAISLVQNEIENCANFSMVGEQTEDAESLFGWDNGYAGEQIQAFYPASWDPSGTGIHDVGPTIDPVDPALVPEFGTVFLGRNNITDAITAAAAPGILAILLGYMTSLRPDMRIAVFQMTPMVPNGDNANQDIFNANLATAVASVGNPNIHILNTNSGIPWVRVIGPSGDFVDNGHFNDNGYDKLAAFLHTPPGWVRTPGFEYNRLPLIAGYDLGAV